MNNVEAGTLRVGSEFAINSDYGGFETVVSDLGTLYDTKDPDSRILALRGFFKPLSLVDPQGLLNIFSIGVSVVSDTNAPRTLAQPLDVAQDRPVVAQTAAQTVYGIDADVQVLRSALLDITPYTDLNRIDGAGWGWHAGVLLTAKMPIGIDLTVPVRLEYRRFRSNYIPEYFSIFYEIERYTAQPGTSAGAGSQPKAAYVRGLSGSEGINGYYGELAFDFAGLFQVGAVYEDYVSDIQASGPNLQAFVSVPALEAFKFKAFYARIHIQGTNDILKFDNRSMAAVEARYEMVSYVYLVGRLTRSWELVTDKNAADFGQFKGTNDWQFGIETNFTF